MMEDIGNNELTKRYYRIGEVSELLGIPQPTLRYWEKEFPGLSPVRSGSNQRYYTPQQIETLKIIRYLLKDRGMKIEAARNHLKSNPMTVSRHVEIIDRLTEVRNDLEQLLKSLEKRRF